MRLLPVLFILTLSLLQKFSQASPIFFNIEVLMHGRSFNYYVNYQGAISKKARFGKTPDVFAISENGQLSETSLEDGLKASLDKLVSVRTLDTQNFETTSYSAGGEGIAGTFTIDEKGFLQWSTAGGDKAVWCSANDQLMVRILMGSDSRCVGWSLKARVIDAGLTGTTEL